MYLRVLHLFYICKSVIKWKTGRTICRFEHYKKNCIKLRFIGTMYISNQFSHDKLRLYNLPIGRKLANHLTFKNVK